MCALLTIDVWELVGDGYKEPESAKEAAAMRGEFNIQHISSKKKNNRTLYTIMSRCGVSNIRDNYNNLNNKRSMGSITKNIKES